MAKYDVTCDECGSDMEVDLIGKHSTREWKLENWIWTCDDCKAKARKQQNEEAAIANAEAGLPKLTGSEKQIVWAEVIRKQKIEAIDEFLSRYGFSVSADKDRWNVSLFNLKHKPSAHWWIDNRDVAVDDLMRDEYRNTDKPLPPEEQKIVDEAKTEALIEATVRPEAPVTENITEIRIKDSAVEIIFPEKRDDFRQIVRSELGYKWVEMFWRRVLVPTNGTPEDRAAEAGNKLLAAGFPICIFNDTVRVHAVYGTYTPEQKRWVKASTGGKYKGWFIIHWPYGEDLYKAAKRLRGSRYSKPDVIVPAAQFQEVLDFAEMYEFAISPGAQEIVESARKIKESALTVSVSKRKVHRLPVPGDKPPVLDIPVNEDIDEEFREVI